MTHLDEHFGGVMGDRQHGKYLHRGRERPSLRA
jgi:hypothetical protein